VREYWSEVFEQFIIGLKKGLTPNPDVMCNTEIKFKQLLKYPSNIYNNLLFSFAINETGADYLATGHYAQVRHSDGTKPAELLMAADASKDQTYFLAGIKSSALQRTLFPVGHLLKTVDVRKMAEEINMPVAHKKDSVGICFIGKRNFKDFISEYIEEKPGVFVSVINGMVVGMHRGAHLYP
jgi:tRNA-specific 2-thiouridylase